ncbi:hypothetical protein NF556_05755 [Ornithinimicrobium faecis]|uniref:WXG100 family type VII secretion target n=1 Tax=Ornithinimicrobium faecis TaxID=2934158 RepID=A0ABY4YWP2_9MICO|nr:hypothetical protein [Ornithinimicrobium sp. HY1793]USQ81149.1 hypothetical protein NF556_05755 [Ornithinimicrobium sp. HY1793]
MGFLDKAKAAANDLASKADSAISQASSSWTGSGDSERLLRDFGLLTWREQHGQAVDPADLTRVREALEAMDGSGGLNTLQVHTQPAPPPPGSFGAPPPPGGAQGTPPPPTGGQPAPGQTPPPQGGGSGTVPPPPPPPPSF